MASCSVFTFGGFLFALCTVASLVLAEIGCPPAETITPCTCDDRTTPRLVCSSVTHHGDLEEVFKNSARYTFQEVHIQSSSFLYVPSMIFDQVQVNELYINNSVFIELFLGAPTSKSLEKLQLENTVFQKGLLNTVNLTKFTSLKTLIVNNVLIRKLPSTLNRNFPSSLKQITLRGTQTQRIMPGAFDGFPYLDKLEVSSIKLANLSRDLFPTVFNVRFLYFDNNSLSSIPSDLFTNMPELQFVSMKNNNITEVPEAAFGNRRSTIPFLRFDGNPLKCNCLLIWLVKNKPEIIGGTCHSPRNLMGRQLRDLRPADFNC